MKVHYVNIKDALYAEIDRLQANGEVIDYIALTGGEWFRLKKELGDAALEYPGHRGRTILYRGVELVLSCTTTGDLK